MIEEKYAPTTIDVKYVVMTCFMCGKEFKLPPSAWSHRKFCSFTCRKQWNKERSFWKD